MAGEGVSLQRRFAPESICFGCGPANPQGLRIESFPGERGVVVCRWRPAPYHHAFEGVLNGGIIGTLLDCHSNWTAAYHMMTSQGASRPPSTVTLEFCVRLRRPTPVDEELLVRAHVVASEKRRATVEATLSAAGKVTATCRAVFVAVGPGHPAYGRW